jgi:uncharacterized protein (TIGR03084 family)
VSRAALVSSLLADLEAESADLDARVANLPTADWFTPTPAAGWDIRDTITHLHQTDVDALLALSDPAGFARFVERLRAAESDALGHVEATVAAGRDTNPLQLLENWRADRQRLTAVLGAVTDGTRVPWFGPAMSVPSFITARLMETWAHGQDVVDALGQSREATPRLRHVAEIGVRARPFAYAINGLEVPAAAMYVELQGPGGRGPDSVWTWGPADAVESVSGAALDFCLLVTQRRHRDDVKLTVTGAAAEQWMAISQAYAGAVGGGREPLDGTRG